MTCFRHLAACVLISFLGAGVAVAAQAEAGGGLTVAVSSAPRTLDPATASDAAGARLLQLTHPALLRWSADYRPVGLVAKECHWDGPTQATCTLPAGQTFTDGTPLTAQAVAAWLQTVQKTPLSPFSQLKGVMVTAPAAETLVFALPAPNLGFLGSLTDVPLANPAHPQAGMGPYRIEKQDTLGAVTVVTTAPYLPVRLTFTPVADATTRLLKLQKGEVDMLLNDVAPELVGWAQKKGFPVVSAVGTSYSYLGLNFDNPLLAKPQVRQALAQALDRPALRTYLLGGLADPAGTLLPQNHPAAYEAPEEPYDPAAAENLLSAAGLPRRADGTRFGLTLLTSTDPFSQRTAQVLQAELAKVGIALRLRPMEWAGFYDSVKKGRFDMVLMAWTGELPPVFYYQTFHSTQTPPAGFNRGHLNDPETDRLTELVAHATTEENLISATVAVQKRLAVVRPYIPLYRRRQVLVTAPDISGCSVPPSGFYTGLLTCRK